MLSRTSTSPQRNYWHISICWINRLCLPKPTRRNDCSFGNRRWACGCGGARAFDQVQLELAKDLSKQKVKDPPSLKSGSLFLASYIKI